MIRDDYDVLIANAAELWGVPFTWIKAVIGAESDFNPAAYRAEPRINDASYGLMQLLLRTARGLDYQGPAEGLYDPPTNIDLGAHLLGQLRARHGDDFSAVYSAYNSGSPTAYRTNTSVRAHVERALTYLRQVEAAVTVVSPEAGSGAATPLLILVLGVVAFFLWRQFS